MLVGLTAVYREGCEVVLLLQNVQLQAGEVPVLEGAAIGLALTGIVGFLTLVAQRKSPQNSFWLRPDSIGGVLLVMVAASGQAMQAGWSPLRRSTSRFRHGIGAWFAVYPNVEGLTAQTFAAMLIIGSYFTAQRSNAHRR